ncbi:MAG: hypothetical protein JJ863_26125 [Deltaproteobacteria bacterium]|nr:hypothetical protein [Deltaproteobacteria bacterium]
MILPVVLFLVFGGLGVAFAFALVRSERARREELAALFADTAHRVGARFVPGETGFFKSRSPSVVLNQHDTQVVADTYVVSSGKSSTTYSRVAAAYSLDRGPVLHIRRQGALNSLGKMLGMQDIEIGDPIFDEAYMIKAPSAGAVLRVLGDDHRLALLHQLPGWWIKSDGVTVKLERFGYPDSAGELAQAMRVATAIASADKRILDLAAAHPDARSEGGGVVFDASGAKGRFSVEEHECVLRVQNDQGGPPFGLDCEAPDAAERLPEGALEPALIAQLAAIGEGRLVRDAHQAWVSWWVAPDADQIEAAWRVLVGVAAPSTRVGAFR